MNKDKKTYVEPNMKVMEVEAEAMMAGSCGGQIDTPCTCDGTNACDTDLGAKQGGFTPEESGSAWKD